MQATIKTLAQFKPGEIGRTTTDKLLFRVDEPQYYRHLGRVTVRVYHDFGSCQRMYDELDVAEEAPGYEYRD